MQQRRLRLGDILDDYCPRERRITNHVVVAMIEDDIRQTRCTTCDAEHEYKQAKAPAPRRKKTGALQDGLEDARPRAVAAAQAPTEHESLPDSSSDDIDIETPGELPASPEHAVTVADALPADEVDDDIEDGNRIDDDGPVHRRLIRATLPRPEGHVPERKEPDFTMRQPGRDSNGNRHGQRSRHRGGRQAQAHQGGNNRFGGQRQNAGASRPGSGPGQGQRNGNGNRQGQPSSQQRGGGRPAGQNRGPGRKRGR